MAANYHEQPQFCATCHVMEPYLETWRESDFLVNTHAEADVVCLDCHEATIEQQVSELVITIKGDYREPLKEREFPMEMCFQCHEHASYEMLAELTSDYQIDGEPVNPHNPHANVEDAENQQFECYNCHKMHDESPGINACYKCHHIGTFENCNDCHES